eukprot:Sspe_Gene.52330::Locus_29004_Transcript_1_1_Confidence_1.000_Length_2051::g.52330::m.52330/K00652/bioF; 8-amino-7-oxononanoate synthase
MALKADEMMQAALRVRREKGMQRELSAREWQGRPLIDFCSNDYLGLARNHQLRERIGRETRRVEEDFADSSLAFLGSSGSRLLSGNNRYAEELEEYLSAFHSRDAALLFNSGYSANLGVLSSIPTKHDVVVFDELVHNSTREGMRLGRQRKSISFKHNNITSLREALEQARGDMVYVVVESVYSMDGDIAPLTEICELASAAQNIAVIVDEAHATGVFGKGGRGVVNQLGLERHPAMLCTVHTFGKGLGVHGAAVLGSKSLKTYLINYARSLVYATALPLHSLVSARCAYEYQSGPQGDALRDQLHRLIDLFTLRLKEALPGALLASSSAIQAVLVPGNSAVVSAARALRDAGFDVLAIRAPTVPKGTERLRVILHAHNTPDEVERLVEAILAARRGSKL